MTETQEGYGIVPISPGALLPAIGMDVALHRRNQMIAFVKQIMLDGTDYGAVPGTDKPTLKKAGAEKLKTFFGMTNTFDLLERIEDWDRPLFYYLVRCRLYRDGVAVGEADGSCNSRESKYRYRQADRTCPKCGKPTILKSKKDGGWFCWAKRGGCGATFKAGDKTIEAQETGRIENPDVADQANTILKMAEKRALVAAVLIAVNASEFFTQDVEDMVDGEYTDAPAATRPVAAPEPQPEQPAANGNGDDKQATEAAKREFYARVLHDIPYYHAAQHVANALRQAGFTGYSHDKESEMWTALQEHANAAANEAAAVESEAGAE